MDNDSPSNKKVISLQKGGMPVSPLSAQGRGLTPPQQKKLIAFMDSIHDFGHTGNRYALGALNLLFPTMTNPASSPLAPTPAPTAEAMAADYATGSIDSASQLKNLCMGDPIAMGRAVSFERRTTAMFDNCALEKAFTKAITWEDIITAKSAQDFAMKMGAPGPNNNVLVIQNGPNPALSYVRALKERKGNITVNKTSKPRIWARNKVAGFVLNYMFPGYTDETVGVTYDAAGAKITKIFSEFGQVKAVITPANIADSASTMLDPYKDFKKMGHKRTLFVFPQHKAESTTLERWKYNENATLFLSGVGGSITMTDHNFNVNNPNGFEINITTAAGVLKVNYNNWNDNVPSGPSAPYLATALKAKTWAKAKVNRPKTTTIIPLEEYEGDINAAKPEEAWKAALVDIKRTGDYEQVNAAVAVQDMFPTMKLILGTGDTLCSTYARMQGQACILGGLGGSGQEEGEEVLVLFRQPPAVLDQKLKDKLEGAAIIRQGKLDRKWIGENGGIASGRDAVSRIILDYTQKFGADDFVNKLNASYYDKIPGPAEEIKKRMIATWTDMLRLKIFHTLQGFTAVLSSKAAVKVSAGAAAAAATWVKEAHHPKTLAAMNATDDKGLPNDNALRWAKAWKTRRTSLEDFQAQLDGGSKIIQTFADKVVADAAAPPVDKWDTPAGRAEKQFLSKIGFNFGFLRGCAKDIYTFINRFPVITPPPDAAPDPRTVASAQRRAESDIMNLSKGKWRTNLEDILAVDEEEEEEDDDFEAEFAKCQINIFIDAIVGAPGVPGTLNKITAYLLFTAPGGAAVARATARAGLAQILLKEPLTALSEACGFLSPVLDGGGRNARHTRAAARTKANRRRQQQQQRQQQRQQQQPLQAAFEEVEAQKAKKELWDAGRDAVASDMDSKRTRAAWNRRATIQIRARKKEERRRRQAEVNGDALANFYTNIKDTVELISSKCNNILIERLNTYWEQQGPPGELQLGVYSILFNLFKTLDRWFNATTTFAKEVAGEIMLVPTVPSDDDFLESILGIQQQAQWWVALFLRARTDDVVVHVDDAHARLIGAIAAGNAREKILGDRGMRKARVNTWLNGIFGGGGGAGALEILKNSVGDIVPSIVDEVAAQTMMTPLSQNTAIDLAMIWSQQLWNHIDTLANSLNIDPAKIATADTLGSPELISPPPRLQLLLPNITAINNITQDIEAKLSLNPIGFSRLYNELQFNSMSFDVISTPGKTFWDKLKAENNPFKRRQDDYIIEKVSDVMKEDPAAAAAGGASWGTIPGPYIIDLPLTDAAAEQEVHINKTKPVGAAGVVVVHFSLDNPMYRIALVARNGKDGTAGRGIWLDGEEGGSLTLSPPPPPPPLPPPPPPLPPPPPQLVQPQQQYGQQQHQQHQQMQQPPPMPGQQQQYGQQPQMQAMQQQPQQQYQPQMQMQGMQPHPQQPQQQYGQQQHQQHQQMQQPPPMPGQQQQYGQQPQMQAMQQQPQQQYQPQMQMQGMQPHPQQPQQQYGQQQHQQHQQMQQSPPMPGQHQDYDMGDGSGGGHKRLHTRKRKRRRRKTKRRVRRKRSRKRKQRKRKRTRRKQRKQRKKRRRRHKRRYKRGTTRKRFR